MGKRDTWHTREPICPHCGHEMSDAWELPEDESTVECGECEKEYAVTRNISVTYTTKAARHGEGE